MKLMDVTLRDGGFVCDFNWTITDAIAHIKCMNDIKMQYVELGYWKQTAKSKNPFYNLNEETLEHLGCSRSDYSKYVIMIDYHYCIKDVFAYPNLQDRKVDLIRLTARKEDLKQALQFAVKLKEHTELEVSFQIINSTNYAKSELMATVEEVLSSNIDIIGFADSHGNLDLFRDFERYAPAIEMINDDGVRWGFHLHNHTGRANGNYQYLKKYTNCHIMDASVRGLGKGKGNLILEEIVNNEVIPTLLEYFVKSKNTNFSMSIPEAYNILCGRNNVTDNYRKVGLLDEVDLISFQGGLSYLTGQDKDSYNADALRKVLA